MSWHKPETLPERVVNSFLRPFSCLYYVGAYLRLCAYNNGILPRYRLPVPVISVGNVTVGGTGKTPVVIDFAQRLIHEGYKVGILSRGYKRKSSLPMVVVSDGKSLLADVTEAGDEPYMMASACPRAVVVVCADRHKAGLVAVRDYGCNVLILDDGFQHLKLGRERDVVLVDYNDNIDNLRLLPGGRLREPLSALARADWVVISKVPENPDFARLEYMERVLQKLAPKAKVTKCRFYPDSVHQLYPHEKVSVVTQIRGQRVLAFCGVARPENFFDQLARMGADVVQTKDFPDHHWLSETDVDGLVSLFRNSQATLAVTTGKDAVKLPEELIERIPVAKLRQRTEWLGEVPVPSTEQPVARFNPLVAGERRR